MSSATSTTSDNTVTRGDPGRNLRSRLPRFLALPFAFLLALGLQPFVGIIPAFAGACAMSEAYTTIPTTATAGTAFNVTVTITGTGGGGPTCAGSEAISGSTDAHFSSPASQSYSFTAASSRALTYSVTLFTAGSQTITATNSAATGSCTVAGCSTISSAITVSAGTPDATSSTIAASPSSVSVSSGSGGSTVTVTLKDGTVAHNVVSGKTVALSGLTGTTNNPASVLTNSSGQAAFTLTDTKVETLSSVGATDTDDSVTLSSTTSASFTVGSISSFTVTGPSTSTAGVAFSVTVNAFDSFGNAKTNYTGIVSFSGCTTVPGNYTFTGGDSGSHTFTNGVTCTVSGSRTVSATDTVTTSATGSLTLTDNAAAVDASQSTISASPSSVAADGSTSIGITVTLKDAFSNLVSGKTVSICTTSPCTSLSTVDSATITPSSNAVSSISTGVASFTLTDTTAGGVTVKATDTSDGTTLNGSAAITFTAGSVSASASTVAASPSSVAADGTTTSTVTVTLEDSHSNPVSGKLVSISGIGSATISPTNGTVSTNSSGQGAYTLKDTKAESLSITATDVSDTNLAITPSTASLAFTVGAVSASSTVQLTANNITADGTTTATVTVTLKDSNSNTISGKTVTLTHGVSDLSTVTVVGGSGNSGTSNSSGVVQFHITDTKAESVTYTATDTTDSNFGVGSVSVTFIAGAVSGSGSTITGPSTVTADGSSTGTIIVTLKDTSGNAVASKNVTLTASGGNSLINGNASVVSGVPQIINGGSSNSSGQVNFTVTNTKSQTVTYSAADSSDGTSLTNSITITFQAGAVSGSVSTVLPATQNDLDDGASTATVTVTVTDANGNAVSGHTVTLTANSGSSAVNTTPGTTGGTAPTNGSGQATFLITDTVAETVNYTAKDTTSTAIPLGSSVAVVFKAGLPSSTNSTVRCGTNQTSCTATVGAGGGAIITVTVLDGSNSPVAGKTVTLSTLGGSSTISPAGGGTSASNGTVTFTVQDTVTEAITYSANNATDGGGLGSGVVITFQAGALASFNVTAASPATAGNLFTVTVSALDGSGNAKTDYDGSSFTLSSNATATATSPALNWPFKTQGSTSALEHPASGDLTVTASFNNGVASIQVVLFNATETPTFTATDGISKVSSAVTVNANLPSGITITPAATTQAAGQPFNVTVAAGADQYGNTQYLGTVTFAATDTAAGVTLPPNYTFQRTDNGSHVFSVTLATATSSADAQVTVTDTQHGSLTATTVPAILVVAAGQAVDLQVVMVSSGIAGLPFFPTIRADDGNGNTIDFFNNQVQLFSSDPKAAYSPKIYKYRSPNDNGFKTYTVTMKTAGTETLVAVGCAVTLTSCPAPNFIVGAPTFGLPAGTIFGSAQITVHPNPAVKLVMTTNLPTNAFNGKLPHVGTAGVPFQLNVTAVDRFGNQVTSDAETFAKTSTTSVGASSPFVQTVWLSSTDKQFANASITDLAGIPLNTTCAGAVVNNAIVDTSVVAPAVGCYSFVSADNGTKSFLATLKTSAVKTIKAGPPVAPVASKGVSGTALIQIDPNLPDHFLVSPGPVFPTATLAKAIGSAFALKVSVVDAYGNVEKANAADHFQPYLGQLSLSSTDQGTSYDNNGAGATLPASTSPYQFVAKDNGAHSFSGVKFANGGPQTISLSGTTSASPITKAFWWSSATALCGSSCLVNQLSFNVSAAAPAFFEVTPAPVAPATTISATHNVATTMTVKVIDASGKVITDYSGTIDVASDDPTFTPFSFTFAPSMKGVHGFSLKLCTTSNATTLTNGNPLSTCLGNHTITIGGAVAQTGISAANDILWGTNIASAPVGHVTYTVK